MTWRCKVLLIDDSTATRNLLKGTLEEQGYGVLVAENLFSFDKNLQWWHPHVIVSDVEMPGASGPEILRGLRKLLAGRKVAFVLMSAKPEGELQRIATECGAHAYFSKARGAAALSEAIERALRVAGIGQSGDASP